MTADRPVHGFQPDGDEYHVSFFLQRESGKAAVAGDSAFRRLVLLWLETRNGPTGPSVARGVAWKLGFDRGEVFRLAANALSADGVPLNQRRAALSTLYTPDAREHLPAVVRLFSDDTVWAKAVPNGFRTDDVQLRDLALASAARMIGRSPTDYGLTASEGLHVLSDPLNEYWFRSTDQATTEQVRRAGFAKWDAWSAGRKSP